MKSSKQLKLSHNVAKLFDTQLPYFKGARQIRRALTDLIAPPLHPPQTIPTRYGFDIVITTKHDAIDNELYQYGAYEAGTLQIIEECLEEGDIFIDVGANIGLMSLLGATRVGRRGSVYAFEPAPDIFNLLQTNISINHLSNVYASNFGLGSSKGRGSIYKYHDNRGMTSFVKRNTSTQGSVDVPISTLDNFLKEYDVSDVKMIKIDVEGWELEVLKGSLELLSNNNAPIIVIEYNTSFPSHQEIYELITSINDYQVFILAHSNWHVSPLIPVNNFSSLPTKGSPNLFCFLSHHKKNLPPIFQKQFRDDFQSY